MLIVIASEVPEETIHIQRYRDYEKFKLPLRGTDLEVPGGPHIAQALEQTRQAVFSGEIPPEEARSYAKQVVRQLMVESVGSSQ
jgi:hypothetical protein